MEMAGRVMDGVTDVPGPRSRRDDGGFSLIEVLAATIILTTGLLGLVGVFAMGVRASAKSTPMLIAREKAREAVESVHAARDASALAWNKVLNVGSGEGIFRTGAQPLRLPGPDGLTNTADDGAIETLRKAGPDGVLGSTDDEIQTLDSSLFTREIDIDPLNNEPPLTGVNPTLRQVTVTVRYRVYGEWREYVLTTYVSAYS